MPKKANEAELAKQICEDLARGMSWKDVQTTRRVSSGFIAKVTKADYVPPAATPPKSAPHTEGAPAPEPAKPPAAAKGAKFEIRTPPEPPKKQATPPPAAKLQQAESKSQQQGGKVRDLYL